MVRLLRIWTLLVLSWAALTAPTRAGDAAPNGAAPLRVLDRFIGTWDVEIEVKPGALVRTATTARATSVNTWINQGQTQHQVWSVTSTEGKVIFSGQSDLTYDAVRHVYRNKTTLAKSPPSESEGVWDPAKQTFTWKSRDPRLNTTTTSISTPEGDGVEFWILFITDGSGKRIFDCRGKSTRR